MTQARLSPGTAMDGGVTGEVDEQFVQSAAAGVDHWTRRVREMDDGSVVALSRERRNILRAIEFGLRLPQTLTGAAALTLDIFPMVLHSGSWREWIPVFKWAASLVAKADSGLERRLWNRVGQLYRADRCLKDALAAHGWVLEAAEEAGDEQAGAEALFQLAEDYREKRAYEQAQRYARQALQRFEELRSDEKWVAGTLNTLGLIAWRRGQLEEAEGLFRRSADLFRTLQKATELARLLNNLGGLLRQRGAYDAAREAHEEAVQHLEGTASELDKVLVQIALGSLYYDLEQYGAAESAFRAADTTFLRRSGHSHHQAYVANGLGNVFFEQGRLDVAEASLRRAVALWEEADDELMRANSMRGLGNVLVEQDRTQEAATLYAEALELASGYEDVAWAQEMIADLREKLYET